MSEFSWPSGPEVPTAEEVRRSWEATVSALPVGAHISGQVIGRRPFGVFVRLDGLPSAVALAEITSMPRGMELPVVGATVAGKVVWHTPHNCQVRIRLNEWDRSS
ncbi:hypothetical protein [Streptomyces carminius]|uniref:hypothetical protein n=1 Tax=Streptomyces carminius TaxID=2665496 RepID=UPI0018EB2E91|nr:hypothetical protein [Streptomyces carminius]